MPAAVTHPASPLFHVRDGLAPAPLQAAVWQACQAKNWYFGNQSDSASAGIPFWKMDLDGVAALDALWELARPLCEPAVGHVLRVERQYANGHTFGQGGQIHVDDTREGCFTLLYYPMPEWQIHWDGETCFYTPQGQLVQAVQPVPNRAVLFDARIPHVGRPPARSFSGLRVTVAFKLVRA